MPFTFCGFGHDDWSILVARRFLTDRIFTAEMIYDYFGKSVSQVTIQIFTFPVSEDLSKDRTVCRYENKAYKNFFLRFSSIEFFFFLDLIEPEVSTNVESSPGVEGENW